MVREIEGHEWMHIYLMRRPLRLPRIARIEEEHRARGCKYSLVFLQLALVIARQAVTSRRHCTQRTRKTRMSEASCKGASDQNA